VNQAISQGYIEEIQRKGVIEKIENMAERKRQRGRKVLSQRKTTVHTRKKLS
jgi:hypothetical protein